MLTTVAVSWKDTGGASQAPVLPPGTKVPVFGTLTEQAVDWMQAQGAPLWPATPELVTVGEASLEVALPRSPFKPTMFSVEITFSAALGVFEFDVQTADTDADGSYVKIGSLSTVNASNIARLEIEGTVSRFVRLLVASFANAATVTCGPRNEPRTIYARTTMIELCRGNGCC